MQNNPRFHPNQRRSPPLRSLTYDRTHSNHQVTKPRRAAPHRQTAAIHGSLRPESSCSRAETLTRASGDRYLHLFTPFLSSLRWRMHRDRAEIANERWGAHRRCWTHPHARSPQLLSGCRSNRPESRNSRQMRAKSAHPSNPILLNTATLRE